MQIQAHGETDVGRARGHNEDSILVDASLNLFVVCDGMGGHAAGEVASLHAVQTVQRVIVVYRGIKPLLTMLSLVVPSSWRKGVDAFISVLDSLSGIDVTAEFKAGKDLDAAA